MNVSNGRTNRDQFLNAVNNLLYADDPRQGVVEGQQFLHPDLRLGFTVPEGFRISNGTAAVSIGSANGQAQFTMAAYSGDLDAYVRQAFQTVVGQNQANVQLGPINRTSVNGIPAAYATARATTQQGPVDLIIFAYAFDSTRAYHFAALAPVGRLSVFDAMFGSMRRLTTTEAGAIRPRKVSVVTVRRGDTAQSLASRMAYQDFPLERFLVLNGLQASAVLNPGQRVKIVTYGTN
jgi:predicted Zn-dependent protease